jgi:type II secretory pathway pseudopilin PulG
MYSSPSKALKVKAMPAKTEEGLTVVETMVAIVIIAIVLIFTASSLTSAFRASAFNENRSKASSIAQDVLAVAKQADFKRLYVANVADTTDATLYGFGKCSADQTSKPVADSTIVTKGSGKPYEGLVYCQARQQGNENGGVGTTFYIQTKVVYLTNGQGALSNNFYPKRVYVQVTWQDVYSGEGKTNTYVTSYTRSPSPNDCIPDTINANGTVPNGCKP